MTTQTNAYLFRRSRLGAFLFIILRMLISYAAIQIILGSHASTRNPDTYAAICDCLNKMACGKCIKNPLFTSPQNSSSAWGHR